MGADAGTPTGGEIAYRLLGPLEAVRTGTGDAPDEPIDLGAPKQRAVLAMLLLAGGRAVPTVRLIDALWGESEPPRALASLQAYVSNLRRVLRTESQAGSPIVRRGGGYAIDAAPRQLDVTRFTDELQAVREASEAGRWNEALDLAGGALALWRGDLLEDFAGDAWVRAEAQGLEELHTECQEAQITGLLAVRRVAPALVAAQALRAAHPLRDRACWLQMMALHQAGRSSEALDEFRDHAARLDDELGLEAGTELRELQVAILRHDPSLAAWPRPAGWTDASELRAPEPEPAEPAATTAPDRGDDDLLVGRATEQAVLHGVLADAAAGQTRWLLLTGPAGIGKTRLAEELGRLARERGGAELWSRCSEEEGAPAWWPIRQLVRALGEDASSFVPQAGIDPDEARFAIYERVATLLDAATQVRAPLVVVIDDVQWIDKTSARCLAHLVGAIRERPVVFVATMREGEDASGASSLFTSLARRDGYRQLTVGPLSTAEVGQLAARVSGQDLGEREAAELAEQTGGNALFVAEYSRLPREDRERGEVPVAVRSVLGRRLAGLDPEVLAVLRAAAIGGDVIDLPTLVATTGSDPDALADLLDEAADERILVAAVGIGGYAFAHGLLRQEILAGLPEMRRRRLHARTAAALAGSDDGDDVIHRAGHLVAAMPLVEAADVLAACRAAAEVAEQRWSADTAAEWWGMAIRAFDQQPEGDRAAEDRDALLVAQISALARAGRGQSVLDLVDAALLEAMRAGRTDTVGRVTAILLRVSGAWPWSAWGTNPRPLVERLSGALAFTQHDDAAHARVLATLAAGLYFEPDPAVPERLSHQALELAERTGDAAVLADALLGRMIAYSGVAAHAEEIVDLARRLQALDHASARVDGAISRSIAAMAQLALTDLEGAAVSVQESAIQADLLGLPTVRFQSRWLEGTLAQWHGDVPEARRQWELARRVHEQSELEFPGSWGSARMVLALEEGTIAQAGTDDTIEPAAWAAVIAAARGDRDEAAAQVDAWLAALGPWVWFTLGHAALVGQVVGQLALVDRAPRLLELLDPHAGSIATIGQAGVIGLVDVIRARLLAGLGREDEARALLGTARSMAEARGGLRWVARIDAALAEL